MWRRALRFVIVRVMANLRNRADQTAILRQMLDDGRLHIILEDLRQVCIDKAFAIKPAEHKEREYWLEQSRICDASGALAAINEERMHP